MAALAASFISVASFQRRESGLTLFSLLLGAVAGPPLPSVLIYTPSE